MKNYLLTKPQNCVYKREKKTWASVISQFGRTYTPFNFPSSPKVKIFQNFWTISTTVLGEEVRLYETKDSFYKDIYANHHKHLQPLTPIAHSTF